MSGAWDDENVTACQVGEEEQATDAIAAAAAAAAPAASANREGGGAINAKDGHDQCRLGPPVPQCHNANARLTPSTLRLYTVGGSPS